MDLRSQRWLTGFVTLICLGLLAAMVWAIFLPPAPERFPEASSAFLYSEGWYGQLFAAVAIVLLIVAALGRKARAVAAGMETVRETRVVVTLLMLGMILGRKVGAVLALGLFFSLLAVAELRRSSVTYTALTDTGFIAGRASGVTEHEEWSSLHHVELDCWNVEPTRYLGRDGSTRVRYRPVRAKLYLRFTGGRSIDLEDMKTYRMSVQQAYTRLESVRAKYRVPIIWREDRLHERFEFGNRRVTQCVNLILNRFPADKRASLTSMLHQGSSLRDQTSASYR